MACKEKARSEEKQKDIYEGKVGRRERNGVVGNSAIVIPLNFGDALLESLKFG